ncbi:hypothetical protein EIMP300_87570 [Escherichia coli]|uniref:3-dehydro-L-gulonate-6-phosphate decarboxylase n=1 Tax=Escherichia coli TaxID=562 RepID=A0A8S0G561_ECOLX|nr:hypothetical protein EIMP300_87570 [Escherichia coli]
MRAVRDLKALYPHKIVLADAKIADAGKILSRMCFEANADWVTVICCADINTAKGALDVAKEFNGDVQIELTGYWTWEQAQQWRDAGIGQVVYHRSRDAQAAGVAWGEADITAIKRLSDMGFKVTVTGGLALEDLPLFKGIPIHVFIAGRSIRDAASPVEAARRVSVQTFHRRTVGLRSGYVVQTNPAWHLRKSAPRWGVLAGTTATGKNVRLRFCRDVSR